MTERKLATVRKILDVIAIEGANSVCLYQVDGWQVVDTIGKYKTGDAVIYLELDSWVPHELAPYLSKGRTPKEYNGVQGERLRTVKLCGVLSQGLLIPIDIAIETMGCTSSLELGQDATEWLNIKLWEAPISTRLAGIAKGSFPRFIPKTNQERIQNLTRRISSFQGQEFEVTEKLEGSSCTFFFTDSKFGVCSRNLELCETEGNTFWQVARKLGIEKKMRAWGEFGLNIALQGELVGPGIQGNLYELTEHKFYLFDVFNITKQEYVPRDERMCIVENLQLDHVPVLDVVFFNKTIAQLVEATKGASALNFSKQREGLVYKHLSGSSSFKVINNDYLLNQKD